MEPGMTIGYIACRHGLAPSLEFRWRRLMSQRSKEPVRADDEVVAVAEVLRLEDRFESWNGCWPQGHGGRDPHGRHSTLAQHSSSADAINVTPPAPGRVNLSASEPSEPPITLQSVP
jgi:hypothetical protein